ncbi:MAG: nitroreductase family deazaflavin-dependent oxidoreductase [Anaerolineae bacterium]|nr:nitroreductase family deazaflavin-dependent oxidoreductase [Anaerolineae bacterium]
MAAPLSLAEENLRRGFKYFNRFMVLLWRLGLGGWVNMWPDVGGRIMVIAHTGRKSGKRRLQPLNYAVVDDAIYCVAGFGRVSDWYRNVIAQPHVEVWLPDGWWAADAEDVSDSPQRLPLLRQVIIASGFAGRLAGLDAQGMSDAEFDRLTRSYRLLRLRRTLPRTGLSGPGDLAWLWQAATVLFALLWWRGRAKSSGSSRGK